jgi:hypothetical protein
MTVRELLQQARAAHTRYRQAAGHVEASGAVQTQPNDDAARLAVVEAYSLRDQAEKLDPTHDDPAWAEDAAANNGVPSAKLQKFYRSFFVTVPA